MRFWPYLMATLTFAGCATNGSNSGFQSPPEDADYGEAPEIGESVKAYFSRILKDPESAQYRKGHLGKAYCNKGIAWGGDVVWHGYAANIYINAKNSYGGYTGFKPYTIVWNRDGSINKHIGDDDFGNSWLGSGLCRWEGGVTEMAPAE